jgi:carbamoyl-phosphate synthase large subunit
MRDYAILMMRSIGNFAGGCNVQFAVSPDKEDIVGSILVYLVLRISIKSNLSYCKIASKLLWDTIR